MSRSLDKIRVRLILGFLMCFCGVALFVTLSYRYFILIERKLVALNEADNLVNSVLEVRRYEKNYFLYGREDDFQEALRYFNQFERIILSAKAEMNEVVRPGLWSEVRDLSWIYRRALSTVHDMRSTSTLGSEGAEALHDQINVIRAAGQDLITQTETLARRQRDRIQGLLHAYRILFGIFFVTTILTGGIVVYFLEAKVVRPLHTIEEATRVVAQGDFRPIAWARSSDEIGSLVEAFNRMVLQLEANREQMIQTEKLSALGTLTSGVAHELNNPLSNISTSCQILMEETDERLPSYHRELLASIEDQVLKARDIVRALLEFSREKEFELKPVELHAVVLDTLKLLKGDIPSHVEVKVEVPAGIVLGLDKARMEQALMNIVMNGIQAMSTEGTLTIRGSVDGESGLATLVVTDTGVGIPAEIIPRIFDPFFTTKEVGRGTGLGLSVTYGIIERHKGRIFVESEVGKGTSVTIQLPLQGEGT